MGDVVRGLILAASAFGPVAGLAGRRRLRAAGGGGPLPPHIRDVAFRPAAGFFTTQFAFTPPFRRNGWPRDFAERPLPSSTGTVPDLMTVIVRHLQPPFQISRSYYHARLEDGVVCWIHLDESANRAFLWELG